MALLDFARRKAVPDKHATPTESKAAPLGVVGFTGPGRPVWSGRSPAALIRSGFLNNPIGFRAVKLIAEGAAAVPWIVQDDTTRYSQHDLLDLLRRPNSEMVGSAFFEALYSQLILTGDCYIELGLGEEGLPNSMHILRSDRMSVLAGRDGWPIGYEYRVGNNKSRYAVENIIHLRSYHPQDDHYGVSPLLAAAGAIDVHNGAAQWSKALLDNAARPSGAIVYKGVEGAGHMTNEQYDRLVDEIESNHQGAANAGRPMLLEGGLDWKPMGFSPSDMEFHRTKDSAAREIALALGVPPMLLGLPGDNTFANYQEANRAFYRLCILPLVGRVGDVLNARLASDDLRIKADWDAVPALATEREAHWNKIAKADFLSRAEKREMLGLPPETECGEVDGAEGAP